MIYYKTYNFAAVFLLIAFSIFVGVLFFWSEPQHAGAVQMPRQTAAKQTLSSDNGASGTNFAWVDNISDGAYIDSSGDSFFTRNPVGELFPIEISADNSGNLPVLTPEMDLDADSGTRIIQSGSPSSQGPVPAGGGGGAGGAGSSDAGDSDSSGTGDTGSPGTGGGGSGSTETDDLSKLQPLPKVHYSFWLVPSFIVDKENAEVIYHLARVCSALSIAGEWSNAEQIDVCVSICARVNQTNPKIPCSIGVTFDPWHRKFRLDLDAPIPSQYNYTIFVDSTYIDEIQYFESRMSDVKKWVGQSNKKYGADIKVGAILLDCERFYWRENDPSWNEGMREALDVIHKKAVSVFPDARIEWYGRGYDYVPYRNIWIRRREFTGKEIMPSLSCSLYQITELEAMRETFRLTCKLADQLNVNDVTPWVALGGGYYGPHRTWISDYDYPLKYSHQMGAELNIGTYSQQPAKYADYDRAKVIIFYPRPFNAGTPAWAKHFIAYVGGATGISDINLD